uniref:Phosphopantothenoylcysteine synthetase/decarboxylase (CoaBC, dfp) n=1 Tax=uncultured marine group II/III euryarchaeote KM3_85_C06 TaxID=1456526 RepID=A0A075HRL8_9EURY|nr:Phosphopantothenoylcysteine synthetase/decarboxylase (coaBC, dfp) [uncultured marine group II/III euryarchaeote KM3_85_C06]
MSDTSDIGVDVTSDTLDGKHILVAISGGIAVVDSVRLLRELRRHGAQITVVMTHSAQQIISPLAIEWASQSQVITDWDSDMAQLDLVDAVLVCPATRHTIGCHIHGILDTPMQMALTAARGRKLPMLFIPSMHNSLSEDIVTEDLCEELENFGHQVFWGEEQEGRRKQPDVVQIIGLLSHLINQNLSNRRRVALTLGATRSAIDSVRWVQNTSSGKTGFDIADYLYRMGHEVIIIKGVVTTDSPLNHTDIRDCKDPETMLSQLLDISQSDNPPDTWIFSAAVLDYTVVNPIIEKIKSGQENFSIELQKSDKHIDIISKSRKNDLKIGFKLESGFTQPELIESAQNSLKNNGLDAVIANHLENVKDGPIRAFWVDAKGTVIGLNDNLSMAKVIENKLSEARDD